MRAIVIGHGSSVSTWLDRLKSQPRTVLAATVNGATPVPAGDGMPPSFATLDAALASVQADAVLLLDNAALTSAPRALSAGLSVVVTDPGSLSTDEVQRLSTEANRSSGSVLVPRSFQYRKCRRMVMRFLRSGWLGAIGHVSCIDRRHSTAAAEN